jgi:hypothetical protein
MINKINEYKSLLILFLSIISILLIPKLGDSTGQYAKLDLALILGLLFYPIFIYKILLIKKEKIRTSPTIYLLIPLIIEIIINIYIGNYGRDSYYDIAIISIAILFSVYYFYEVPSEVDKNIIFSFLIGLISVCIILITLLTQLFYDQIKVNPGAIISGNQNISAYILLLSTPFILNLSISRLLKLVYFLSIFIIISFIYKSRIPALILLIYSLVIIFNRQDFQISKHKIILGLFIITTCVIVLFIFNERFNELLKIDIYLRVLPLLRIYEGAEVKNLLIGYGTNNFATVIYSFQNIYPILEVLIPDSAFIYAHNFLIDRLISGGIIPFIFYFLLFATLILRPFIFSNYQAKRNPAYHALVIAVFMALYDVVFNSITGYLFFVLIVGLLSSDFLKLKIQKIILIILPLFLLLPGYFYKFNHQIGHHDSYNQLINQVNAGLGNEEKLRKFSEKYPHYAEIDTVNTYFYLKNDSSLFDENFKSMNIFNKYYNKRLHLSSQYFALKNKDEDLLSVYSDILYKILILSKQVSPIYKNSNVSVVITNNDPNLSYLSVPCCKMSIPRDMFNQIKYVNSGVSDLKISPESLDFVVAGSVYSADAKSKSLDAKIVREFLLNVNKNSEAIKF